MPVSTIDPTAAPLAGMVAAQLMEGPAYTQRALGLAVRQHFFDEVGSIWPAPERWRRLAGWVGHVLLAIAIVLLYTSFLAAVSHNDHLGWWGVFAGDVDGLLGGGVVGAFADLHPRMPHQVPAPGVFYRHYGRRDFLAFILAHLGFGFVAGVLYALLYSSLSPGAAL
jgi:hypothetical protein